jgi:aspartyl-tRNA(Asn)/glutamyl-tRNA(Gln) amidotransferase subunit A
VTVEEIELPWTRAEIMGAAWAHYGAIFAPLIEAVPGEYLRYTNDFLARAHAAGSYFDALRVEAKIQTDLAVVFTTADALICPTSGIPAFLAGVDYVDSPLVVDGVRLDHNLEAPLAVPFNMAGRCPVLSVPSGIAANGIPTGLQIAGRPYDDPTVFALGQAVFSAIPWYTGRRPPS